MSLYLAKTYLPYLYFCDNEPFFPIKIGYTLFDKSSISSSFAQHKPIEAGTDCIQFAIEYQIYWHYDITHMYDLEHVWVYIDYDGNIVKAESSMHGKWVNALRHDRTNIISGTHLQLYAQPGKHALSPYLEVFDMISDLKELTLKDVGKEKLNTHFYNNGKYTINAHIHHIICDYMQQFQFTPLDTYTYYSLEHIELLPWEDLKMQIPHLIDSELDKIIPSSKHIVILLDSGDTLVDEGTEIRDENDIVIEAKLIPGAAEMVKTLVEKGYTLALVADGYAQSFKNVLTQNGIYDYFTSMIYSECIKVDKPNARMFKAAMGALELSTSDLDRIVMVGNNLKRDIRGANAMGITSIFLKWSPRYPLVPSTPEEIPSHTIHTPLELVELIDKLNGDYEKKLSNPQ